MKIVVIEDEILVAEDLIQTIRTVDPGIEVLTHLSSVKESIDYLQQSPDCGLIFSDIQLGDGLSFDIFSKITPPLAHRILYGIRQLSSRCIQNQWNR